MSDRRLRRLAWGLAIYAVVVLIVSIAWLFSAADYSSYNWLEVQVSSITGIGAPILGLIIIRRQPRHRLAWLWLAIGILATFRTLGHAVFYGNGSQFAGYSPLEYFLLWSAESFNLVVLIGQALLLLWFPDGQLPTRRWRFVYVLMAIALMLGFVASLIPGSDWNGGASAGGIVIENPYGFLPLDTIIFGLSAFLIIILCFIFGVVSLILRYRSATQLVRTQIKWFVVGAILFVLMDFVPVFLSLDPEVSSNRSRLLYVIAFSNSIPLYLAIGVAILRYRLYDIDVIIRKTLVYAILSTLLGLVYFGSVVLLQQFVGGAANEQSPLVIVISTLIIAALFGALRHRVQGFIDHRFYRRKVNTQRMLAEFAQTARDEVSLEALTAEIGRVVQDTMEPATVSVWLKESHL